MLKKSNPHEWVPWELRRINPDIFYFKEDKNIPNSPLPLLIYRGFFDKEYEDCEGWLKNRFSSNRWFPAPRLQVFGFTHYYINTHLVIGVCSGEAKWQLGGTLGITTNIEKGDVVVIPAGVALRHLESEKNFKIVGAGSVNEVPRVQKEQSGNHAHGNNGIANIALPETDPILGPEESQLTIWMPADSYSR
ncbi:cupin domain-containing protein [Niabella aurantiaca]|uniref:cupin domain-containing protein n=1 Tax=Niabella aurantiaca TaxID=379900 RepID=UPI0003A0B05A|nr:cupin [Niabella aurantiaca]